MILDNKSSSFLGDLVVNRDDVLLRITPTDENSLMHIRYWNGDEMTGEISVALLYNNGLELTYGFY